MSDERTVAILEQALETGWQEGHWHNGNDHAPDPRDGFLWFIEARSRALRSLRAIAAPGASEKWTLRFDGGIGLDRTPGCFVCGKRREPYEHNISALVQTKEVGERIVQMFGCWARLDYRDFEPRWIQVKVGACDEHKDRLTVLAELTADGVVTKAKVERAAAPALAVCGFSVEGSPGWVCALPAGHAEAHGAAPAASGARQAMKDLAAETHRLGLYEDEKAAASGARETAHRFPWRGEGDSLPRCEARLTASLQCNLCDGHGGSHSYVNLDWFASVPSPVEHFHDK